MTPRWARSGLTPPLVRSVARSVRRRRWERQPLEQVWVPWTDGYTPAYNHKRRLLFTEVVRKVAGGTTLADAGVLANPAYAFVDERVIEYAWCVDRLCHAIERPDRLLDVGCVLNQAFCAEALESLIPERWFLNLTYEPLHWPGRSSMVVNDIRACVLPSSYFDVVASLSTLEHIGLDNSRYTGGHEIDDMGFGASLESALTEMSRVTRPSGSVLITVPFGRPEERPSFRVFGRADVERMIEILGRQACTVEFFRVTEGQGWYPCEVDQSQHAVFGSDVPAAKAIACVRYVKPSTECEARTPVRALPAFES